MGDQVKAAERRVRDYSLSRWLVLANDGYFVRWLGWARAGKPLFALDAMSEHGYTAGGVRGVWEQFSGEAGAERRSVKVVAVCELGTAGLTAWKAEEVTAGEPIEVFGSPAVRERAHEQAVGLSIIDAVWRCWRAREFAGAEAVTAHTAEGALRVWSGPQTPRCRLIQTREGDADADVLLARVVKTTWWRQI